MKAKKTGAQRKRKTTTFSVGALARAEKLMELFNYKDFNDLLDRLITDEYERRSGKIVLGEDDPLDEKDKNDPPIRKHHKKAA